MKYAAPLAIALIVMFPSCATHSTSSVESKPVPAEQPGTPDPAPNTNSGLTPMGAFRGAQQAAGAINTVRTFATLF